MKKVMFLVSFLVSFAGFTQSVGINGTGASPNPSAMLDIVAADKGLLIPRIALTGIGDIITVTNAPYPVSLLVYNNATAGSIPNNVVPGYYYWDGTNWVRLITTAAGGDSEWKLTGNANTVDGTNFIGTTDNVPLNFKVNGVIAGRIDQYYSIGNTFLGGSAGISHSNTTGHLNAAFGRGALYFNVSGSDNTSIGSQSLFHNLGNGGTSIGFESMAYFPNAEGSVAVGYRALRGQPTPANNTGLQNTAIGVNSLIDNTSGGNNTASGYQALFANNTGSNNTATGSNALTSNTTGSNNTAIGYQADVASGALTNATAIGNGAVVDASNKVRIGNTAVTVIEGQVAYSFPSDARFKHNIQQNVPGLDFINKLKPVTYLFDEQKLANYTKTGQLDNRANDFMNVSYNETSKILHTGFLAQDIEKICKELGYEFDGLHKPSNDKDHYSLAYSQFIMPLVKGMQEQQLQIEVQKQINKQLNEKMQLLQKQMEELKQLVEKLK